MDNAIGDNNNIELVRLDVDEDGGGLKGSPGQGQRFQVHEVGFEAGPGQRFLEGVGDMAGDSHQKDPAFAGRGGDGIPGKVELVRRDGQICFGFPAHRFIKHIIRQLRESNGAGKAIKAADADDDFSGSQLQSFEEQAYLIGYLRLTGDDAVFNQARRQRRIRPFLNPPALGYEQAEALVIKI